MGEADVLEWAAMSTDSNDPHDPHEDHVRNLRRWREGEERDLSLEFIGDHVKKKIARPHKQVGQLAALWTQHVPAHLLERTALASMTRGVLTVHVADSAALYELDRLLRAGLERTIKASAPTTLRRIKLTVAAVQ